MMKTEILSQMGIINELNSMVVKATGIEKQYLRLDLSKTVKDVRATLIGNRPTDSKFVGRKTLVDKSKKV